MRTLAPGPRRARRGFTLLEMLTVMIIVGVVTATSMGKAHTVMQQERLQRAATAMQGDLDAAFAIAVLQRVPIRVSLDSAHLKIDVANRAGTDTLRTSDLGAEFGITAGGVKFSRPYLEVYPNGMANDTLTITLTAGKVTKSVCMSRTGLIRTIKCPK